MSERDSYLGQSKLDAEQAGKRALDALEGLQEELDQLREQLAWSNRLGQLGMLTAGLAHEINNFLTPVRSYAQLALANPEDRSLTERALRAAAEGTRKTTELAERVLSLASPNPLIQTSVCDVNSAIASAIKSLEPLIKQGGIDIQVDVEPAEARIDPLAMEQVLINLITNACHAMMSRQCVRKIWIRSNSNTDNVSLSIRDTGPGVAGSIQAQLFEPFIRNTAAGQARGSGLGLNICKQLVDAAGGTIDLKSSSDQGSEFEVVLPLAESRRKHSVQ